jgi:uncharacterized protein YbaR (Trm112 family)
MISPELLQLLRCPLDPGQTHLEASDDGAVCQRCRIVFPMRDGILCMRVEEAILPPGCASIKQLPCQERS